MNLRKYLRQNTEWKFIESTNEYGEPVYSDPVSLRCRKVKRQRLRRSAQGVEVMSSGNVTTIEEVATGDLLDGEEVIASENIVDRRGKVLGWVSYLE